METNIVPQVVGLISQVAWYVVSIPLVIEMIRGDYSSTNEDETFERLLDVSKRLRDSLLREKSAELDEDVALFLQNLEHDVMADALRDAVAVRRLEVSKYLRDNGRPQRQLAYVGTPKPSTTQLGGNPT